MSCFKLSTTYVVLFSGIDLVGLSGCNLLAHALAKHTNPQEMAQELAHEINSGLGDRQATVHVGTLLIGLCFLCG